MDDIKKNAMDEQAGGKMQNLKGKVKEGVGKVTGNERLEDEGQADQAEGKIRDKAGKAVRDIHDAGERLGEKLSGKD